LFGPNRNEYFEWGLAENQSFGGQCKLVEKSRSKYECTRFPDYSSLKKFSEWALPVSDPVFSNLDVVFTQLGEIEDTSTAISRRVQDYFNSDEGFCNMRDYCERIKGKSLSLDNHFTHCS
jgi:hypothetical protein